MALNDLTKKKQTRDKFCLTHVIILKRYNIMMTI